MALLSATGISNQEQIPGNTGGKSGSPTAFSTLLSLFVTSTSATTGTEAKMAGAEPEKKSDSPDNTAGETLLTALMQYVPGQSPDSLEALLSADPNAGGATLSGTDSSALVELLKGSAGADPLLQKLLDALGAGPEQRSNSDSPGNTAAQALLTALMQYVPGQSPDSLEALLSADPNAGGATLSGTDSSALVELLKGSAGADPLLQKLLDALGAGNKAAANAAEPDLQAQSKEAETAIPPGTASVTTDNRPMTGFTKTPEPDLQTQFKEVETAIPPGTASVTTDNRPVTGFTKTPEPVLQQSGITTATLTTSPGTDPAPGDASKLLATGLPAQAKQPTDVAGQVQQKTQAQESPLLQPEKVIAAKSLQNYPQPTRLSDQEVPAFSAQPIAPQQASLSAGTGISNASAAEDNTLGSKVIGQIVDSAHLVLKGSNPSMSIQLKPEFLGDLKLVVEVEHGIVNAHFVAQNQTTANLIAARLPELRQALNDQGVSWQHLSVSYNGGQGNSQGASSQSQQQMSQPQMQFASGYGGSAGIDEPQTPQAYQWTGAGTLNCII